MAMGLALAHALNALKYDMPVAWPPSVFRDNPPSMDDPRDPSKEPETEVYAEICTNSAFQVDSERRYEYRYDH